MRKTLVFSIATNGYHEIFSEHLESQRKYAKENGYEYELFKGNPPWGIDGTESAWLKIPLCIKAMDAGYTSILFLDADCYVKKKTPNLKAIYEENKSFYICKDYRIEALNTGVFLALNDENLKRDLWKALIMSDIPTGMMPGGKNMLYEMGHLNYFLGGKSYTKKLPKKWNDNHEASEKSFVIHGVGDYEAKPRSKSEKLSKNKSILKRIKKGLRIFRLIRSSKYYWQNT
jgi:hypothetical protein